MSNLSLTLPMHKNCLQHKLHYKFAILRFAPLLGSPPWHTFTDIHKAAKTLTWKDFQTPLVQNETLASINSEREIAERVQRMSDPWEWRSIKQEPLNGRGLTEGDKDGSIAGGYVGVILNGHASPHFGGAGMKRLTSSVIGAPSSLPVVVVALWFENAPGHDADDSNQPPLELLSSLTVSGGVSTTAGTLDCVLRNRKFIFVQCCCPRKTISTWWSGIARRIDPRAISIQLSHYSHCSDFRHRSMVVTWKLFDREQIGAPESRARAIWRLSETLIDWRWRRSWSRFLPCYRLRDPLTVDPIAMFWMCTIILYEKIREHSLVWIFLLKFW